MIYPPDAPTAPRERLAYLAERAGLLVGIEEKVEQLAYAEEQQPYPGPSEEVRTMGEGVEALRELAAAHAEPDFGNPLDVVELGEALRSAEELVEQLIRLGGAEELAAVGS
ncbi:hypothetical protein ACFWNL_18215 [Kitasatospora sp. NPDC058397]|uniref:hypothetical protein n=1 Tax=unclassified Kitasatospora TaxID=2633591 RepID=UPI00364D85A5